MNRFQTAGPGLLPGLLLGLLLGLLPGCAESSAHAESAAALPEPFTNSLGMRLVPVPAGAFAMGSDEADPMHRADELPRHERTIERPFLAATTEVTVGQFRRFVEATGYRTEAERDPRGGFGFVLATGEPEQTGGLSWRSPGFAQTDTHPVVQVSWIDAEAFCAWLSEQEGRTYRLPTEVEWERLCRAGTTTRWYFGDDPADLPAHANVADRSLAEAFEAVDWSEGWDDGHAFTAPVGERTPNAWGLHDVAGNVWEWCADWHDPGAYRTSDDGEASAGAKMRAIRGGGWYDPAWRTRSAQRAWFFPVFRYCMLSGFRVVAAA